MRQRITDYQAGEWLWTVVPAARGAAGGYRVVPCRFWVVHTGGRPIVTLGDRYLHTYWRLVWKAEADAAAAVAAGIDKLFR